MTDQAYPLQWPEGWPRAPYGRRGPSQFGKNLGFREIEKLQSELRLLGTRNVVISSNRSCHPFAAAELRDMTALTGRRSRVARDECWHVYFGDVRVGPPHLALCASIIDEAYRTVSGRKT